MSSRTAEQVRKIAPLLYEEFEVAEWGAIETEYISKEITDASGEQEG